MEVVASLSQGRTAAAQCGFFTHKSVPVIFEPPCTTGEVAQGKRANSYIHFVHPDKENYTKSRIFSSIMF